MATLKLSPDELAARRRQLNSTGFQAWLSPIVLLLVIYIGRSYVAGRSSTLPAPSTRPPKSGLRLFFRRASWLLSTTYITEFGPLYIQIIGLLYAGWLFYLTSRAPEDDFMHMHVTKAFGHVAVSQLPFHYLLSIKSARLNPISWATGLTHERLNAVHRLFGRIVHLWLAVHAVLYLRFFIVMGFLATRIQHRDVRLGILAFWSFNFLGLLALPPVRRKMYHVLFYQSHVVLSAVVVPVLWFHVPYTRWLVGQVAAIYMLGAVARFRATRNVQSLKCQLVEGTDLVKVKFGVDKGEPLAKSVPGQHVYVVGMKKGGSKTKTPFTIAHAEQSGKSTTISVVLRNLGGPGTAGLANLCSDPKSASLKRKDVLDQLQIEGPYGEASEYMPSFLDPTSQSKGPIILFAGGIGVTYTLPIYLSLLSSPSSRSRRVKFILLVKMLAEIGWVTELLVAAPQTFKVETLDVAIFVTRPTSSHLSNHLNGVASLESLKTKGLRIHDLGHRPDLKETIDEVFVVLTDASLNNEALEAEVSVFICGPSGLSRHVRRAVGRWVCRDGRNVRWFEEVFGFGGS